MATRLALRTGYWNAPAAKAAFCALARDTFDLEFGDWDSGGFWDEAFHPFTYFDDAGRAVANVCAYSMDLVVAGRHARGLQLSTVATRPEHRRCGLARALTEAALAWGRATGHEFTYLFANDHALEFYRALGFTPVAETAATLTLAAPVPPQPGARALDPGSPEDRGLLYSLACDRAPVSRQLGAANPRLLLFHALGPRRGGILHIPALEAVVLLGRDGGALTIFDIVARRLPRLADLLPYIAAPSDRTLTFRFMPDQLGDLTALGDVAFHMHAGGLHVLGPAPLPPGAIFPATSVA